MSYYRRPMGDYRTYGYAGDPGWLSKIWKVGKAVLKSFIGIPPKAVPVATPIMVGGCGSNWAGPSGPRATGANVPAWVRCHWPCLPATWDPI